MSAFVFGFWLFWVFVAEHGLSLVAVSRGYSSLQCTGFSLRWFLLWSTGSKAQASGSEEVLPENFGVPLEGDRDVGALCGSHQG